MIRRALAIVAALLVLLAVLALHALPAASEVPVVSGVVPAGEFVEVTPGATEGIGVQAGRDRKPSQPARSTPSPSVRAVPSVAPVRAEVPTASVTGIASWFASPIGVSAAGPALRAALGAGWRGTRVRVTGPAGSAWTVLGDWMAADRLVDLDVSVFPLVCGPLSRGICPVTVVQ
jgi:hypothetical protein